MHTFIVKIQNAESKLVYSKTSDHPNCNVAISTAIDTLGVNQRNSLYITCIKMK